MGNADHMVANVNGIFNYLQFMLSVAMAAGLVWSFYYLKQSFRNK